MRRFKKKKKSGAAECDCWTGEQWRGVRLVEKAMEGLWTVFLWFRGGTSSNSPLLQTQTGSAHINAYRLSSVNVEHSYCPHLKQLKNLF